MISRIFLNWLHQSYIISVSGDCIFKFCQIAASISVTSHFHNFWCIIFGGFLLFETSAPGWPAPTPPPLAAAAATASAATITEAGKGGTGSDFDGLGVQVMGSQPEVARLVSPQQSQRPESKVYKWLSCPCTVFFMWLHIPSFFLEIRVIIKILSFLGTH